MADFCSDRWIHPAAILIATKLSDLHRLMPYAIQMGHETGARLELLHVLPASAGFTADAAGMPYYDREGALDCASDTLQPWCERARKEGLRCDGIVREGRAPAREITAAVRQFHADRLLLGTRSPGKLGKLLLGSVAEQVLRSVNLPVFTVGPEAHLFQENLGRQPAVLFATTLGEDHQASAALACQIAASQRAKLIILHVLPPVDERRHKDEPNVLYTTALHELGRLTNRVREQLSSEVEIKILYGNPAIEILAEAKAREANLIVMGAAGHLVFDSITHDRTVYRVLAHAPCPVLSLHGSAPQPEPMEAETLIARS